MIFSLPSVEENYYSALNILVVQVWPGYAALTISQDTSGFLYFIPNPARRMFAAAADELTTKDLGSATVWRRRP